MERVGPGKAAGGEGCLRDVVKGADGVVVEISSCIASPLAEGVVLKLHRR